MRFMVSPPGWVLRLSLAWLLPLVWSLPLVWLVWLGGSSAPFPLRVALLAVSVITSPFRDPSGSLPGRVADDYLHAVLGRRFRGAAGLAQARDLVLEVGERLETPVDRGEPQVGHLVQFPQRAEDGQAHFVRGDFGQAAGPDRFLHLLSQDGQLVLADRPALAGTLHAADDLVPGERLGDPAALGHHQDDRLLRGEPAAALRARPPATDRGTVVRGPAVDDPAVRMPTERAVHAITSPGLLVVVILLPNTTSGRTTTL